MVLVDDADLSLVLAYHWHLVRARTKKYAMTHVYTEHGKRTTIRMHQLFLRAPYGFEVDHKNENGLDNRRCNLRIASKQQNQANRGAPVNNKSGFKGVSANGRGRWRASIFVGGKTKRVGDFDTAREAAAAYDRAALLCFGRFARLNRPKGRK